MRPSSTMGFRDLPRWALPAAVAWVLFVVVGNELLHPPLDVVRILFDLGLASALAWSLISIWRRLVRRDQRAKRP